MESVCPFARKVNGNKYYCEVLDAVIPNIMGLHTTRYENCEVYQEAMGRIELFRKCLLKALKLGERYVEEILSRINDDYYVVPTPEECGKHCEKLRKRCICNVNGFCVLKLQRVEEDQDFIELEPVKLNGNRRKKGLPLLNPLGRRHK